MGPWAQHRIPTEVKGEVDMGWWPEGPGVVGSEVLGVVVLRAQALWWY